MKKLCFCAALCGLLLLADAHFCQSAVMGGNRIMDQDMSENLCALTFDDGPSPNTDALLDMLNNYGIKASFFLLGKRAEMQPDTVRRILAEGHEIGNHSWSHPNLRVMTTERQKEELHKTDQLLRSLGATPLYIRPPYGAFDDRIVQIANELGVDIILWSLDSRDWKSLPADYAKLTSTRGTVYDSGALRGIFLFHDTHKSTVDDLPRIIANLQAGGCDRFVTVSEYLGGIQDPEPPLLMTRHEVPVAPVVPDQPAPAYASGSGPVPMARCSRPWNYAEPRPETPLLLEDAQAAVKASNGG